MKKLAVLALCLTTVFTLGTSVSADTLSSTTAGSNTSNQQVSAIGEMSINGITTSQVLLIHQLRYMNVFTPQEPLYPMKRFFEIFEMYSVPIALYIFYLSSFFLYIKIHIGEAKQCKKKEHLYFKMRMVHGGTRHPDSKSPYLYHRIQMPFQFSFKRRSRRKLPEIPGCLFQSDPATEKIPKDPVYLF